MLKRSLRVILPFALTATFMVVASCADEENPEEPVTAAATETPAAPPESTDAPSSFTPTPVYFAFDDYTLSAETQDTLNKVADYMKANSSAVIQVEGHCDERGSIEYNLALGERRAKSVKNYLVQLGVGGERLPTISYGEEKPAVDGHSEEAWSRNRRAEFSVQN